LADRAGFWPARMSPMWAAARVPLSNPPRPWWLPGLQAALEPRPFAPADRRQPGRRGSGSGSDGLGAASAARAALWGRLETVQKVCTDSGRHGTGRDGGTAWDRHAIVVFSFLNSR
jgi:hypothetical protein